MRASLALVALVLGTVVSAALVSASQAAAAADSPSGNSRIGDSRTSNPLIGNPQAGNPLPRREKPPPSPITDHFALRASYFTPQMNTGLRVDSRAGRAGTALDGESDLGLDDRLNQGRAEVTFRLLERNRLRVDAFRTSRYGEFRPTSAINVGEQTFAAGDVVATDLDFDSLAFTYTYSVFRNRRFEAGLGVGLHLLQADLRSQVATRFQRQDNSATGIFPTFAADATYVVAKRWSVTMRAQYLSGSANSFSGSLSDYHADVQYRWKPNFAVGLGYSALRGSFDASDDDFTGRFALSARGPELFLRVSF